MSESTNKRKPGRPTNHDAYQKMLSILKTGATSVELQRRLKVSKRTIHYYLQRAEKEGHRVIKNGASNTAPYLIIE